MDLILYSNIKNNDKGIEINFETMSDFRENIAYKYDNEFGSCYSTLKNCVSQEDFDTFNNKINSILEDKRFKDEDQDLINFFFIPDKNGKISYKVCKKIYEFIENFEFDLDENNFNKIKELLLQCYKHKSYFRWKELNKN